MWYVGLDAHVRRSTFWVLDENGEQIEKRTVHGTWTSVLGELRRIKEPFAISFEASTGYGYLFSELGQIAKRIGKVEFLKSAQALSNGEFRRGSRTKLAPRAGVSERGRVVLCLLGVDKNGEGPPHRAPVFCHVIGGLVASSYLQRTTGELHKTRLMHRASVRHNIFIDLQLRNSERNPRIGGPIHPQLSWEYAADQVVKTTEAALLTATIDRSTKG